MDKMTDNQLRMEEIEDKLKANVQCQANCGDGTGTKPKYHIPGCPMLWYEKIERNQIMDKMIAELAERITIDYANLSGRETANRAEFRELVIKNLTSTFQEIIEETQEKAEKHFRDEIELNEKGGVMKKNKLKDKCWYWVCYAQNLKDKDTKKYAEIMAKDILELFIDNLPKEIKILENIPMIQDEELGFNQCLQQIKDKWGVK